MFCVIDIRDGSAQNFFLSFTTVSMDQKYFKTAWKRVCSVCQPIVAVRVSFFAFTFKLHRMLLLNNNILRYVVTSL